MVFLVIPIHQVTVVHSLCSRISDFEMNIEADVIAEINHKAPIHYLDTLKERFCNLKFADDGLKRDNIDILVGSDCSDSMFGNQENKRNF